MREWRSRDNARRFVENLVSKQPIATMHLAWVTPSEAQARVAATEAQAYAESGNTAALAGLWETDFYRGGVAGCT